MVEIADARKRSYEPLQFQAFQPSGHQFSCTFANFRQNSIETQKSRITTAHCSVGFLAKFQRGLITNMLAKMVNRDFLLSLASSLLTLVLRPLVADAVSVAGKTAAFATAAVEFLARDDTVVGCSVLDDDDDDDCCPQPHREPVVLTCGDAAAVTARLGLCRWTCSGGGSGGSSECRACGAAEAVAELVAAGSSSKWELEEAFHVFDRGEDGFICVAELWAVMRRLGFPEGARYEDCRRMIAAFDEDGDGRISFPEFRRMMENAAC